MNLDRLTTQDPARQGRLAVAMDDGFLLHGSPADEGELAAMIDDRNRERELRAQVRQARRAVAHWQARGNAHYEKVERAGLLLAQRELAVFLGQ